MMNRSLEGREKPAECLMIDRLTVRNFRCYESLDLQKLSRINIVVGENASGKTAFLESLFFAAAGSPEMALRFRALRGLGMMQAGRTRASYEALWRELFFDQNQNSTILARIQGSAGKWLSSAECAVSYRGGRPSAGYR